MRNIHNTLRQPLFLVLGLIATMFFSGTWNGLAAAPSSNEAPVMTQSNPESTNLRHELTHTESAKGVRQPVATQSDADEMKYRISAALARLQARKAARAAQAAAPVQITQTPTALPLEPTVAPAPIEPAPVVTQTPTEAATPVGIAQEIPMAASALETPQAAPAQAAVSSPTGSPMFEKALAKMELIKSRRIELAQKSGITLPSRSGDIEKTSPTLSRLNQSLKAIINRLP